MRYSEKTLEAVNALDIRKVAERIGMTVKSRGRLHWTTCPWHDDGSPSLQLGGREAFRSLCKCYACGAVHGVVDLVMTVEGRSFPDAVGWLCQTFGINPESGSAVPAGARKPVRERPEPRPLRYCSIGEVRRCASLTNALSLCLWEFFPRKTVDTVTQMYLLGTDYASERRCHTLFPSIDGRGCVHNVKLQVYDINRQSPRFGHSVPGSVRWVGEKLLQDASGVAYDRDTECLFGEHLLGLRPDAVVALVESPKNAIVGACRWPEMVWVAAGSKSMLSRRALAPLRGRKVLVFPDRDAAEEWQQKLSRMGDLATFSMSHALDHWGGAKSDIADWVMR